MNVQITIELVQHIVRVRGRLDVLRVTINLGVNVIDQVIPLELGGTVNVLLHQMRGCALGAAKAAVHMVRILHVMLGNVNRGIVKLASAPEASGLLVADVVHV
jgi:formylmethanofuran:tetrahydromethanopterin formyltransferase